MCSECGCHRTETLLALCDVLVIKALETIGKRIVRADRSRFKKLGDAEFWEAHTIWQADDFEVNKALKHAWDAIPLLLDTYTFPTVSATRLGAMLDSYVHDLVITGTPHFQNELEYRMSVHLGIPLYSSESGFAHA